jgi:hypothetical protein
MPCLFNSSAASCSVPHALIGQERDGRFQVDIQLLQPLGCSSLGKPNVQKIKRYAQQAIVIANDQIAWFDNKDHLAM